MMTELEKGKITNLQLALLITAFIQGSILPVSFMVGICGSDTWLAILTSMVIMLPFFLVYAAISRNFSGKQLVLINDEVYGKILGKIISAYYLFFLFVTLSLNINDLGTFYSTFIMPDTPLFFFLAAFTAVCAYAVWKGLETIARLSFMFVVIMVFIALSTILMLSERIDLLNLLPLFDIPAVKFIQSVHLICAIPFGEVVIFLIINATAKNPEKISKSMLIGLLAGGVTLCLYAARNSAVLGEMEDILALNSFHAVRLIEVGEVFTRMDMIIGIGLTIILFLKSSLLYYALVVSLAQLFGLKSYVPLIIPVAGIEMVLAETIFTSSVEHAEVTLNTAIIYLIPPMFIFPVLTIILAKIRKLSGQKRGE